MNQQHTEYDSTPQAAREQDYATSGVFNTRLELGYIHSFFSPNIVPSGLTDRELAFCVRLHKKRKKLSDRRREEKRKQLKAELQAILENDYLALEKWREAFSRPFGQAAFKMTAEEVAEMHAAVWTNAYWYQIPLPRELIKSPMTRENFILGVKKLIARMKELDR